MGSVIAPSLINTGNELTAQDFSIFAKDLDRADSSIRGRLNNIKAPSGLSLHVTDTTDMSDYTTEWENSPAFVVSIVLEGRLDAWLDGFPMKLGADNRPSGQFWNINHPTRVRRRANPGTRIRKVIIGVPRAWIETILRECTDKGDAQPDAFRKHLFCGQWAPSKYALGLAEQLVNPAYDLPTLQVLTAESKATEIVREALHFILTAVPGSDGLPVTIETQRAQEVRDYIICNRSKELSLAAIASAVGMSVGSLQSAFKATYKCTIGAYIREQRLHAARDGIEQDGMRVSQAAYLAGYDNPGSFSTAFRKQFGFAPSRCKR